MKRLSHEGRVLFHQTLLQILRTSQRVYYPELPFPEAAGLTVICSAIYVAQFDGKPHTAVTLARHLELPRTTLLRRLSYLESKNIITRRYERGQHLLEIPAAVLSSPAGARALTGVREMLLSLAAEMSKMDTE